MSNLVQGFLDFVTQHPNLAGFVVFLTAAAEAIAVIGALVPGTAILIGVGTLVGLGHLQVWPILVWAALGAVAGDGLSYWIGHRYGGRLRGFWPFSRRPELLARGEAFFARYGGMSIAVGRFLPGVRAVVPLVAGMVGMAPLRFYVFNVASALAWSPAHILPAAFAGAALGGVGAISGRLVAAVVVIALLALVLLWALRAAFFVSLRFAGAAQVWLAAWAATRNTKVSRTVARILSPGHADLRLLGVLAATLIVAFSSFVAVLEGVVGHELVSMDANLSQFIQSLRTSWTDGPMVAASALGDTIVTVAVTAAAVGWLVLRRRFRLAAGVAGCMAAASLFVAVLKGIVQVPRPIPLYSGAQAFAFPSSHTTTAIVLYGILGWIVVRSWRGRGAGAVLAALVTLVAAIAVSRIYLAAHWPSDVTAGLLFGVVLLAIFAMVFRAEDFAAVRGCTLIALALVTLVGVGSWHIARNYAGDMERYARQIADPHPLSVAWRDGGWRELPRWRIDLAGETEEPIVLQWRGDADFLRSALKASGWIDPVSWSLQSLGNIARGGTSSLSLPVVPAFHAGLAPALIMVKPAIAGSIADRYVLRAWNSGYLDQADPQAPLLLASITVEKAVSMIGQATFPLRAVGTECSVSQTLTGMSGAIVTDQNMTIRDGGCGGPLILAGP